MLLRLLISYPMVIVWSVLVLVDEVDVDRGHKKMRLNIPKFSMLGSRAQVILSITLMR